jgi:hypothetical protein
MASSLLLGASFLVILDGTSFAIGSGGTGAAHWTQRQEISASDGAHDDDFGAVAVSSGTILVGASQHAVGAKADQGAAYIFTRSGAVWSQRQELTASDGAKYDDFGLSVAIAGKTALIGAPFHKVGAHTEQGVVYVFIKSGGIWQQHQELTAPDGASEAYFGASLALSGSPVPGN